MGDTLKTVFPGRCDYLLFKNHIRHIQKVAVVSDNGFLSIMPRVVGHFTHAEAKHFGGIEKAQAMAWLTEDGEDL